jgi:hypothetical protein
VFQRRFAGLLGATVGTFAAMLAFAASGHAEQGNPNAYECSGSVSAGHPEAGSEGTPVKYIFSCNGPITGYQLESQVPIEGLQASPEVLNSKSEPVQESFSCGGEVFGYALNCVGAAKTPGAQIVGEFFISSKLCQEPRVDPLLTVTYAYLEKEVVTQAISGPFDLGRPHGCRPDAQSGFTRLSPQSASAPSSKGKHGKRHHKGKKGSHGKGAHTRHHRGAK